MALEVRAGKTVPIPCRHCGKAIAFPVAVGVHSLTCPGCSRSTRAFVTWESGELRIRTATE